MAGDPFANDEQLLTLRTQQRRALWSLPEAHMSGLRIPTPPRPADESERSVFELVLRLYAARDIEALSALIAQGYAARAAAGAYGPMMSVVNAAQFDLRGHLEGVMAELNKQVETNWVREIPDALADAFYRFVVLCSWADTLADDGYRDDRVPGPRS